MAIVNRRVFVAKVGVADQLVKHLQEGTAEFKRYGLNLRTRILTDYHIDQSVMDNGDRDEIISIS